MLDQEKSAPWLSGLHQLNGVIHAHGQPLIGNLCYHHKQEDYLASDPTPAFREKRERLREAVINRRRMLEVGVNGGHSAYVALTANPDLEFHGIDVCEHVYVESAVDHLADEFPGRVHFYRGSCLDLMPELAHRGEKFDVFHIDGAKHTYLSDLYWASRMISGSSAALIMDDTEQDALSVVWKVCTALRVIEAAPARADGARNTSELGTLRPLPRWKQGLLRCLVVTAAAWVRIRNTVRRFRRS
jgi:predicted O-methyltransferase YrrM